MTTLLLLDTETTSTDPKQGAVIELGLVLWSVEHKCTVAQWSDLIQHESNEAEATNGIPPAALGLGIAGPQSLAALSKFAARADYVVAHNCEFDRSFLPEVGLPWLCTMDDFQWPIASGSRSLVAICVAHGVPVVRAHRALTDCMLIASLLERCAELGYSVEALIEQAKRPKALFVARVSYDDREKAKSAGFRWEGETKRWLRKMAIEDTEKLGFKVEVAA